MQPAARRFLFLQGPHGPFFFCLARRLRAEGAACWRVGFNAGDRIFWPERQGYIPYRGTPEDWGAMLRRIVTTHRITDLVLYGDTRPIHATAVALAPSLNLTVHVFEEGYLRPWWITYERGGSNGHSPLMRLDLAQMRATIAMTGAPPAPAAPSHWGEMRHHVFYGALYHALLLLGGRGYPGFRPHRALHVGQEFRLYLRRLLWALFYWADRRMATARVKHRAQYYHLVLLQLEHDSNFVSHAPFDSGLDFIRLVIDGFALGAPAGHHLVFKAHPLEDGRVDQRRAIRDLAAARGISGRIHYVRGGKLARLLDGALSGVTVNSTAGQQVLWRGLPLRAFGRAVYGKPGLVSEQPLDAFFRDPVRPDPAAYRDYRRFLLATSQVAGGFYSRAGRRRLLRRLVALMLADADPYAAPLPQLRPNGHICGPHRDGSRANPLAFGETRPYRPASQTDGRFRRD